jgi:hypothetical protein
MTKVLGLHVTKVFCIQKEKAKSYKEGMATSSPEVDGGTGSSAAGGGAADTAEATEGEIVVNNAGANFFAFSKKPSSHHGCGHGGS